MFIENYLVVGSEIEGGNPTSLNFVANVTTCRTLKGAHIASHSLHRPVLVGRRNTVSDFGFQPSQDRLAEFLQPTHRKWGPGQHGYRTRGVLVDLDTHAVCSGSSPMDHSVCGWQV